MLFLNSALVRLAQISAAEDLDAVYSKVREVFLKETDKMVDVRTQPCRFRRLSGSLGYSVRWWFGTRVRIVGKAATTIPQLPPPVLQPLCFRFYDLYDDKSDVLGSLLAHRSRFEDALLD